MIQSLGLVATIALVNPSPTTAQTPSNDAAGIEFFEKRIRPLLVENCYQCHGPNRQRGGLRLDTRDAILRGGDRGPAIEPGSVDASRLVQAIRYADEDLKMPPKGKLKDEQIADLTAWVKMGAPTPKEIESKLQGTAVQFDLEQRRREHWVWQPVQPHQPPAGRDVNWPRSAVDQFILAKLEEANVSPASPADKRTLLRRVHFDLIGLPPTPLEVADFLSDDSPAAFAKVVDRLLESPQFGERWARHWLDLVRYAETRGHEFDPIIPNAYQYRDYVIRAFNADVPYDQFVTEHVAGDLVERPRLHATKGFNESILGTGFWFLGEEVHSPVDIRGDETDRTDNKIDCLTKTFLGLTVSCARCHDHKFDAIASRDYYALAGFLMSSGYRQVPFESMEHNRKIAEELNALRMRGRREILPVLAQGIRPQVERSAEYLMAARVEMQKSESSSQTPGAKNEGVSDAAASRDLDAGQLGKWVEQIKQARDNREDPLHVWAVLAMDRESGQPQRIAQLIDPLVREWKVQEARANGALKNAKVIVDYSNARPEDWLQDGFAFGLSPVRPGEIRLGTNPSRPIVEVCSEAAARNEPMWDALQLAPGTERDPGKVTWIQSGRTLRTPTVTLTTGKLHYLVRGSGNAYAAVDSHRMIEGPLHGVLVKSWDGNGKRQWIEQDLSDYKGHRVHVEFSPKEATKSGANADLSILMVVEADAAPGQAQIPNDLMLKWLSRSDLGTIESLAQGFQLLFLEAVHRIEADQIVNSPDTAGYFQIANWVITHSELFPLSDIEAKRLAETSKPFIDKQSELASNLQPKSLTAPAMLDGNGVDENLLVRGNHRKLGEPVPRGFLQAVQGSNDAVSCEGSGRLELARRITHPSSPLVSRVLANRVWYHLFGRGIVPTVDNFGVLGERPTHSELLDYLASCFVQQGWSVKKLIRQLVLTSTYQMSSTASADLPLTKDGPRGEDPQNLLFSRMPVRRLEGESIRDTILAVSSRLDRAMFGPSVEVHLTPFMEGRGRPGQSGPLDGDGRRSIYLKIRRNFLHPMLLAFDTPVPFSTIGRRSVSNVPAQALALMNSPFVVTQARLWAEAVVADNRRSPADRVTNLYETAFTRPPTPVELADALTFLDEQRSRYACNPDDPRPWADLCHVLMNVKEFIFIH